MREPNISHDSLSATDLSLPLLINATAFAPPSRKSSRSGRPINGPLGDGLHPGKRRGIGLELDSIGPFQDGDDPRHIDWSATARTGRAHVRRFLANVQRPIVLIVDLRASMYFGTSDGLLAARACLQAAGLSAYFLRRREPVSTLGINGLSKRLEIPIRAARSARARAAGLEHLLDIYHEGLTATDDAQADLASSLQISWNNIPFNHDVMVISDFSQLGLSLTDVIRLRRRQSVHALIMSDPIFDNGLAPGNYPGRLSTQAPIESYRMSRRHAGNQQTVVNEWRIDLITTLQQSGIDTVWESASMPISSQELGQ